MIEKTQLRFRGRAPLCVALCLGISLAGCGDKSAGGAASTEPSASAAATKATPPKGDAAVVAELKKVATCPREEGSRKDGCEAADAWEKFVEKLVEEDDLNLSKEKKLTTACFSLVTDGNENVRETAYNCLSGYADGVEDPKAVLSVLLEKIESETNESVRQEMLGALDSLEPTKHGKASDVLALAKKLVERKDASYELSRVIQALTPNNSQLEPSPEAVSFAVDLIENKKKAQGDAVDLLSRAKSKSAEACKALLTLVETKENPWARGLDGMSRIDGACKEQQEKVIDVIVAKAGEPEGYDKGFLGADVIYFQRLAEKAGFSAEQKTKLKTAVEPLLKAATKEHQQKGYQQLLDTLK